MFNLRISHHENKSNDEYLTADDNSDEINANDSYEELDKAYNNTTKIRTLPKSRNFRIEIGA